MHIYLCACHFFREILSVDFKRGRNKFCTTTFPITSSRIAEAWKRKGALNKCRRDDAEFHSAVRLTLSLKLEAAFLRPYLGRNSVCFKPGYILCGPVSLNHHLEKRSSVLRTVMALSLRCRGNVGGLIFLKGRKISRVCTTCVCMCFKSF